MCPQFSSDSLPTAWLKPRGRIFFLRASNVNRTLGELCITYSNYIAHWWSHTWFRHRCHPNFLPWAKMATLPHNIARKPKCLNLMIATRSKTPCFFRDLKGFVSHQLFSPSLSYCPPLRYHMLSACHPILLPWAETATLTFDISIWIWGLRRVLWFRVFVSQASRQGSTHAQTNVQCRTLPQCVVWTFVLVLELKRDVHLEGCVNHSSVLSCFWFKEIFLKTQPPVSNRELVGCQSWTAGTSSVHGRPSLIGFLSLALVLGFPSSCRGHLSASFDLVTTNHHASR